MNLKHLPLRWSKNKRKNFVAKEEKETENRKEPKEDRKRIQLLNTIRFKINITQSYLPNLLR